MTSQKPGKTQLINHYLINNEWYLVDLPGYGYAQRGKTGRSTMRNIIENYILERQQLTCLFVLIDCRLEPQKIDLEFMNRLGELEVPFTVIFTKTDKISNGKLAENAEKYQNKMLETWEELPIMLFSSAEKREGREDILTYIDKINREIIKN